MDTGHRPIKSQPPIGGWYILALCGLWRYTSVKCFLKWGLQMYDVIVVGAGPAGSTAAKVLAEKGLHVLLVERHKLPRYKS